MLHSGSCVCGAIGYEISAEPSLTLNCHCSLCRKTHGAAFASLAWLPIEHFRWTAGEELLGRYSTSPGFNRLFCSRCGSPVGGELEGGGICGFTLGTLDDQAGVRPSEHIFTDSKAPWHEITDALPQSKEGSDALLALFPDMQPTE